MQPSAEDVMKTLIQKYGQISFSLTTLQRALKKLGFTYKQTTIDRSLLKQKDYIQRWLRDYLRDKRQFEEEGREFRFTDETWYNTSDNKFRR